MDRTIIYSKENNKESNKRFWQNVNNYIYANNLSKRKFGEMMTGYIKGFGIDAKEYDSNDITQYIIRGSVPGDLLALVAIAKVIDKPLEDLIEQEFSMEELKSEVQSDGNDVSTVEEEDDTQEETEKWSADKWKDFSKEDQQFVKDLLYTGLEKDSDGKWHIRLDGEVFCVFEDGASQDFEDVTFRLSEDAEVRCIGICIKYGKENEKEYYTEVPLDLFVMGIFACYGSPEHALSTLLKDQLFEKYINIGLLEVDEEADWNSGWDFGIDFCLGITLKIDSEEILRLQSMQIR